MLRGSYEETLDMILERMSVKEEFNEFREYAEKIRREDDYDDHDDDYYR